jgi:Protein of unknown function (DUF3800)
VSPDNCQILESSRTLQLLLSTRGSKWRDATLIMFTAYIDDSGTDPNQRVATATALIIPAAQLIAMESEWHALMAKEGCSRLHTSEMAANNPDSEFFKWDRDKQSRVLRRCLEIAREYSPLLGANSFAVKKMDYDEVAPAEYRKSLGNHYTWAVRHLLQVLDGWKLVTPSPVHPFEYIFDWMGGPNEPERIEIEQVMAQMEAIAHLDSRSGEYTNYAFRRSKDIPGLQCADAISWICYRRSLSQYWNKPIPPLADEGWQFCKAWLRVVHITRENLKEAIDKEMADGTTLKRIGEWNATGRISQ